MFPTAQEPAIQNTLEMKANTQLVRTSGILGPLSLSTLQKGTQRNLILLGTRRNHTFAGFETDRSLCSSMHAQLGEGPTEVNGVSKLPWENHGLERQLRRT